MHCRLPLIAAVAAAVFASGCSNDKSATPSSAEPTSASQSAQTSAATAAPAVTSPAEEPAAAPVATLDGSSCVDITGANLDLAVATNTDAARAAADKFAKYHPPADVTAAVEHFVSTGGAQFDDPDYDRYNSVIDNWVKQVCPL
jgi:hypothetical protein